MWDRKLSCAVGCTVGETMGVVFVDLRDRTGLGQVVFKPDTAPEAHEKAGELRSEYVIAVRGKVEPRGEEAINPKLPPGRLNSWRPSCAFEHGDDATVCAGGRRTGGRGAAVTLSHSRLAPSAHATAACHTTPTLAVGASDVY